MNAVLDVADAESQTVNSVRKTTSKNCRTCARNLVSGVLTENFARFVARPGGTQLILKSFYNSRSA